MEHKNGNYEGIERRKHLSHTDLTVIKQQLYESIQEDIGRGFTKWAWTVIKKGVSLFWTVVVVLVCALILWFVAKGQVLIHGVFP